MAESPDRPSIEPTRRGVLAGMAGVATAALSTTAAATAATGAAPAAPATAKAAAKATEAACAEAASLPLDFMNASQILTGVTLNPSYGDIATWVLGLVTPTYGEAEVARLVKLVNDPTQRPLTPALEKAGLLGLAQTVATIWYTGASTGGAAQTVPHYNDALVWRSCSFTKPPMTCGGPFGYWENPEKMV